jgi:hypothetical protein
MIYYNLIQVNPFQSYSNMSTFRMHNLRFTIYLHDSFLYLADISDWYKSYRNNFSVTIDSYQI